MNAGEVVLIITAIGSMVSVIVSILTAKSTARKEDFESLRSTLDELRKENQRLILRIQDTELRFERLEVEIVERDKHIVILENSLRDATQSSADRGRRIIELESEVQTLRARVIALENGQSK